MRDVATKSFLAVLALCGTLAVPLPAPAQAQTATLTPADQGWVSRIGDALSATKLFKARFQQIAPNGQRSTGIAYLDRPGRMRFEYDKPSPLLLVANDGQIVYQDRDIGQITTIPEARTPLGILLRPELSLSGDVTVTGLRHVSGRVEISLVRTATPAEGTLTLIFDEQPLALRAWVVRDAQGRDTQIDLFNVETPASLPDSLFVLPKDAG